MANSLQAAATLMQPTKVGVSSRSSSQLRPVQSVGKAFGVETGGARLTCSLDVKELSQKFTDAAKIAGFALATSALVVSSSYKGLKNMWWDEDSNSDLYKGTKGENTWAEAWSHHAINSIYVLRYEEGRLDRIVDEQV